MAGKKKIELFVEVNNTRDFNNVVNRNKDKLICAEIYSSYFGSCTALDRLFTTIKLDWSNGQIILLKVLVDEIEMLQRFWDQSEPLFIFIVNKRITQVFRGVDSMKFAEVARQEIFIFQEGLVLDRPTYDLDQATPEEISLLRQKWQNARAEEKAAGASVVAARKAARHAARKHHRAELMVPYLQTLNFVMYWPHAKHAHPELYERWDLNNIIMVGREELQLSEDMGKDILYAGDADLNEASMHALVSGSALVICFRLLDEDQHFVSLVRRILYEDIPPIDESKPLNEQPPQKTAFNLYKTYSPTRDDVLRKRKEDRQRKKEEITEKRARRLSEMQRLARQEIEDTLQARRQEKEQKQLELLRTGNLEALDKLRQEPDDDETSIVIPEELPEGIEEELSASEEEDENEYFPPPGLMIPALYAPPNDVAKANGLALLFPKLVKEKVSPEPEFLPPHALVLLQVAKRHKAIEALAKYKRAVIHMGIFKGTSPYKAEHIAFSVKQYDAMDVPVLMEGTIHIAFMMSTSTDIPLLQLMDLSPEHVSRDSDTGEEECASMFPVTYGDGYLQFEDFPSS